MSEVPEEPPRLPLLDGEEDDPAHIKFDRRLAERKLSHLARLRKKGYHSVAASKEALWKKKGLIP